MEQGGGPPAILEMGRRWSKPGFGSGTEVRVRLFGRFAELGWRTWEATGRSGESGPTGSGIWKPREFAISVLGTGVFKVEDGWKVPVPGKFAVRVKDTQELGLIR